jgi:hypothetical protein
MTASLCGSQAAPGPQQRRGRAAVWWLRGERLHSAGLRRRLPAQCNRALHLAALHHVSGEAIHRFDRRLVRNQVS